jgi:hypothetical protein
VVGRVLGMNQTEKRERTVLESAGKWGGGASFRTGQWITKCFQNCRAK